ncbi:MAG: endonuclease/exonuclease/phosphatase family protein [Rikenellaceae bacterium]
MATDYYSNSSRREVKKRRNPIVLRIFDVLLLLVSIVLFVAVAVVVIAPYIHPSVSWIFPIIGLFTPIIYLISLFVTLYWVIRWKWFIAAPMLLVMLLGLGRVPLYVKINTSNDIGTGVSLKGSVRLLSYNIKSLSYNNEDGSAADSFREFVDSVKADVICLHEFYKGAFNRANVQSVKRYNLHHVGNLAILSRYPIVGSSVNIAPYKSVGGGSIWVDLLVGSDTLRVFNNHLCSTTISDDDTDFITSPGSILDSSRDERVRDIFKRLHAQSIGRAEQAEVITEVITQSRGAVVVCGDFNDTPTSYTYHTMSKGLQDAFSRVGVGYSNTFSGFMNILRIDYILGSKQIDFILYERDAQMRASDHYPIITNFKIKET